MRVADPTVEFGLSTETVSGLSTAAVPYGLRSRIASSSTHGNGVTGYWLARSLPVRSATFAGFRIPGIHGAARAAHGCPPDS